MFKKLRKIATTKFAGFIFYWVIRLYSATFRLKIENEEKWLDYLDKGGKVLICLWHQQLFFSIFVLARWKKYRPSVMISRSLDGDIVSRIVEAGGFFTVRGSSSRGGSVALKEMIKRIKETGLGAHILDGPRGPAGIAKIGVIAMAYSAGAAIVPGYAKADRAWYLKSWDQFAIPKPFARVTVHFFDKIILPPLKNEEDEEIQRKSLENILRPHLYL
jgi:hypothetical protein